MGKLFNEFKLFLLWFVTLLPEGTWIGSRLRRIYWLNHLRKCGTGLYVASGAVINGAELFDIGNDFLLGKDVLLDANNSEGVFIGNNIGIAKGVYLRASNHKISDLEVPILKQGHECASYDYNGKKYSVIIEDNVWVGAHAIILSGAKLGKGSVVSAGTVVSGEIPAYSVVVGNPGRVVSNRKKNSSIKHEI